MECISGQIGSSNRQVGTQLAIETFTKHLFLLANHPPIIMYELQEDIHCTRTLLFSNLSFGFDYRQPAIQTIVWESKYKAQVKFNIPSKYKSALFKT